MYKRAQLEQVLDDDLHGRQSQPVMSSVETRRRLTRLAIRTQSGLMATTRAHGPGGRAGGRDHACAGPHLASGEARHVQRGVAIRVHRKQVFTSLQQLSTEGCIASSCREVEAVASAVIARRGESEVFELAGGGGGIDKRVHVLGVGSYIL